MIDVTTRNRRNRSRGKLTSSELARYLGGRNVEGLLLPWDVEARGCRVQAKRDDRSRSAGMRRALIERIPPSDDLRALFEVAPRQRIASGAVTLLLEDWIAEHGWILPAGAKLVNAGLPLISMPLPVFRDIHISMEATA